jgi:hypothetical protein
MFRQSEPPGATARAGELKQSNSPPAREPGRESNSPRPPEGAAKNPAAVLAALLAGNRNNTGSFNNRSSNANFWSSSQNSASNAWNRNLNSSNVTVNRNNNNKTNGFSVRCLKDCFISKKYEVRSALSYF